MCSAVLPALTRATIGAIAAAVITFLSTTAGAIEPVVLSQADATVAFEVIGDSRNVPVTVSELEALGLYRVTTRSPWEKGELTFEGPLFSDVVSYLGFDDANALRIRALDGYTQVIPRQDWIDKPLILATRQDGKQLVRRTQGPTRLIYPLSEYPDYDAAVHDGRWVWLIETIDRVD